MTLDDSPEHIKRTITTINKLISENKIREQLSRGRKSKTPTKPLTPLTPEKAQEVTQKIQKKRFNN